MSASGVYRTFKSLEMPCCELPLSAEAVSKDKFSKVGGNYDRHFDWNNTKVGIKLLAPTGTLPKWCAVPLASKSHTF